MFWRFSMASGASCRSARSRSILWREKRVGSLLRFLVIYTMSAYFTKAQPFAATSRAGCLAARACAAAGTAEASCPCRLGLWACPIQNSIRRWAQAFFAAALARVLALGFGAAAFGATFGAAFGVESVFFWTPARFGHDFCGRLFCCNLLRGFLVFCFCFNFCCNSCCLCGLHNLFFFHGFLVQSWWRY